MRILVVGGGAREHAIAWKLSSSPLVDALYVAPGNAGTASVAENLPVRDTDLDGLVRSAKELNVDVTFVGPEVPLAMGIVDRFTEEGLRIFGPTAAAARIESSKVFAKELMVRHGIPTGRAEVFESHEEAARFVGRLSPPLVVKADGLAAGKGVTVARTQDEALTALRECMVEGVFGEAGERVLVEEWLTGLEVSVFRIRGRRGPVTSRGRLRLQARSRRRSRPEHGRHGRVQPAGVLERCAGARDSREHHAAGRAGDGGGRLPVQRRAVRRPHAHGGRPKGHRVQLPHGRSGGAGPDGATQDGPGGNRACHA